MSSTRKSGMLAKAGPSRPAVGVFGKVPGYAEHLDDLDGSSLLVDLKRRLYDEGVRRSLDQGIWKELETHPDYVPFGHVFVEIRADRSAAGEITASRDAVGRDKYPFVAAWVANSPTMAAELAARVPQLDAISKRAAGDAGPDDLAKDLTAIRASVGDVSPTPDGQRPLASIADHADLGPDREGLRKVFYSIDRQLEYWRDTGKASIRRAVHLRMPACLEPVPAATVWAKLLVEQTYGAASVLVFAPRARGWIDAIIGEPGPSEFYCLHAPPAVLPAVHEIPYEFTDAERRQLDARIAESLNPLPAGGASQQDNGKRPWWKIFGKKE